MCISLNHFYFKYLSIYILTFINVTYLQYIIMNFIQNGNLKAASFSTEKLNKGLIRKIFFTLISMYRIKTKKEKQIHIHIHSLNKQISNIVILFLIGTQNAYYYYFTFLFDAVSIK